MTDTIQDRMNLWVTACECVAEYMPQPLSDALLKGLTEGDGPFIDELLQHVIDERTRRGLSLPAVPVATTLDGHVVMPGPNHYEEIGHLAIGGRLKLNKPRQ